MLALMLTEIMIDILSPVFVNEHSPALKFARHFHPRHYDHSLMQVVVLDFASLYPSVFQALNLCYCTMLQPEQVEGVTPQERL